MGIERAQQASRRSLGSKAWTEVTVQIFELCACPLDPLNPHSVIKRNEMKSGIGDALARLCAAHSLIMNVSLYVLSEGIGNENKVPCPRAPLLLQVYLNWGPTCNS